MRTPDAGFWSGRRVLLTGHSGFKGSWLAFWLAKLGANVTGLALPPATLPSAFAALDISSRIESRFGDIRDDRALDDVLSVARPEIVFHLAAQATVRRARAEPQTTFDVNVMGTVRLLEAIRRASSVSALVVVTSDKCYADRPATRRPYIESDPLGGSEPYSASKACAEIVTSAYRASLFADTAVRIATARAGNVIGGGDWTPERLVTDLVRALATGSELQLRYPAATRPWQHVLEPLCGYLVLAEHLITGNGAYTEAWNFGPDPSGVTTVQEFVGRFERAWGKSTTRGLLTSNPPEALHLLLDSSHASYELGWRAALSLDEAVEWTVRWFQSAGCDRDAVAVTDSQIESYVALRAAPPLLASAPA